MARLSDKHKPRLQPIPGLDGAFVRPLRVGQLDELEDLSKESVEAQVLWLGQNIVVDAEGEPFEDLVDPEEVAELDSELVVTLIGEVIGLYSAGVADLEKKISAEPSEDG